MVYSRHLNKKINCKTPACTHVLIIISAFDFLQTLTGTQMLVTSLVSTMWWVFFLAGIQSLPAAIMVTVRNTRSTKTYLEQPRLVTCISRRWQKTLIPRFTSENHIDCFLNLSIKMSTDQRPTWVVPQLTDKMKNSLKDQIVRKDIWVVGATVFLVLLLLFQRYWDCL